MAEWKVTLKVIALTLISRLCELKILLFFPSRRLLSPIALSSFINRRSSSLSIAATLTVVGEIYFDCSTVTLAIFYIS